MPVAVNRDQGAGGPRTANGWLGDLLSPWAVPLSPSDHQLIHDVTPVLRMGWHHGVTSCVNNGRFRANPNNQKRWLLLLLGFHPVAQAFLLLLLRTFLGELEDCVEKPEMLGTCFLKRVSLSDSGLTQMFCRLAENLPVTPHINLTGDMWTVLITVLNSSHHSPTASTVLRKQQFFCINTDTISNHIKTPPAVISQTGSDCCSTHPPLQ